MIKHRGFALGFRIVAFVLCLFGIIHNLGLFDGQFYGVFLLYYTLQSNLLALVLLGILTVRTAIGLKKDGMQGSSGYFPRTSACIALCVAIVLIVFWIVIAPTFAFPEYMFSFTNLSVHLINPLVMIIDYVLFSERGHIKLRDPFLFVIVPVTYFIQATALGFAGTNFQFPQVPGLDVPIDIKPFPYVFMDYFALGGIVAINIILIAATFIGIAYLLWFVDNRRAKKARIPKAID
jgi:hypothetical protein